MDHLYTTQTTSDETMDTSVNSAEFTYKLTEGELNKFVKLRATNEALFTGRRNASKIAWRAILKEMGLQGKMSTGQANKKWENLKKKYKELKYPPPGIMVNPTNWPWFSLIDDAMEGRLAGSDVFVSTSSMGNDSEFLVNQRPRKRVRMPFRSEIEFLINGDDTAESEDMDRDQSEMACDREEMEQERAILESDRVAVENEKTVLERERMVLDRERAGLEREMAAVDRDRASLEREKAAVERERAAVDRDRAQIEKERAAMDRDRASLERDRAALERNKTAWSDRPAEQNGTTEDTANTTQVEMEPASMERRQKFLNLFEKLIENF